MVPVKLTLSNFLSYGSEPQTLDFTRFHVACLSGRNGQGKSALLDALTWALWGEARKSSGAQKPDEELLRIGTRRMLVDFVFEVESDRYRVVRAYSRSATGKTSKSELELQLIEQESGNAIPLTAPSMRETQEVINERLGLDYGAFVNSALLLQGRSDEFTKKRPAERKNILGRVLNLGKYDRLAEKARVRQGNLNSDREKLEREIEIFSSVLENEGEWNSDYEVATKALADKEKKLASLKETESDLVAKYSAFQALEKELQALSALLKQYETQKDIRLQEQKSVQHKIEEANELLNKKKDIQQDYEIFLLLQKERDELDTQREVYRGIEAQMQSAKSSLALKKSEYEAKLERLTFELQLKKQEHVDLSTDVASKDVISKELSKSREAAQELEKAKDKLKLKERLDDDISTLEQIIFGQQSQLSERLSSINEKLSRLETKRTDLQELQNQFEEITQKKDKLSELKRNLSLTTENGLRLNEKISELEGHLKVLRLGAKRVELSIDHMNDHSIFSCPTCGSSLGDAQREIVLKGLTSELEESTSGIEKLLYDLGELKIQRESLREEYKEIAKKEEELSESIEVFHQLKERIDKSREELKEYELEKGRKVELEKKIKTSTYALKERDELEAKRKLRNELDLDPDHLNALRSVSAKTSFLEDRLRKIQFSEGKVENLERWIKNAKREMDEVRQKIDNGDAFSELKGQIAGLAEKLKQCSFDPDKFELVKRSIKENQKAPERLRALMSAEDDMTELLVQQKKLDDILASIDKDLAQSEKRRSNLEEELSAVSNVQFMLKGNKEDISNLEKDVLSAKQSIGELSARLQQVKEAKTNRKLARKKLKAVKEELNIYKKLRTAFGKNGIQSLIIEQSLPEIEDRASEILHRLTDGKMQVHLETIKDKKSGGTKETLEIIITDDQGIPRAYETYSGGEAFRINFALRIALSQMLAERNGVKIRTLGIDEGFGTQDEEGIQCLIEAIQEIQDDFDKIIVITHLNRLKEAFPVRIEVAKDPVLGSQFSIIEQ